MDLPDVRISVQWRATCDMCDLWQRFGRVARTTGEEGTGILFYEKAHLDATRAQKKATAEKRKAVGDGGPPAKKRAILATGSGNDAAASQIPSNNDQALVMHPEIDTEDSLMVDSCEIERKAKYNQRASTNIVPTKKTKNVKDSNPALDMYGPLDDFINAGTREDVRCRHTPVKLYFDGPIRIPGQFFTVLVLPPVRTDRPFHPRRPPPLRQDSTCRLQPLRTALLSSLLRYLQPGALRQTLHQPAASKTRPRT